MINVAAAGRRSYTYSGFIPCIFDYSTNPLLLGSIIRKNQPMQGEIKTMITPHCAGFTLIELVMVIVIVGILAITVIPRFNDQSAFESRGFHDETMSLLRYAQKTAIAQRRTVCVSLNATGVALTIDTDTPADGICNAAPTLPNTPRGGSGLAGSIASFQFTPLGNTDQATDVTVTIAGSTGITVEAATGYVHE